MDLKNLSSNWKKLQKSLQLAPSPPKRKATEDLHQRPHHDVKRRKPGGTKDQAIQRGKGYHKRRIMDDKAVIEVPTAPTKIVDRVNEGLSSTYAHPSLRDPEVLRVSQLQYSTSSKQDG